MSVHSNDKITPTLSPKQTNRIPWENNLLDRKSTVDNEMNIDETHDDFLKNRNYDNEFIEEYEYAEDYEEGKYKNKNEQLQRSRSLLEEDEYPKKVLTANEARQCLNRIGKIGSGLTYAFIQIDVDHRNLTNIEEIANFKYLSLINVSHNRLDLNALDVLRGLEYSVVIQADHNIVNSLCLSSMQYLRVLTLNSNRVSSLCGLKQPSLECLELNDNQISRLINEPNNENLNNKFCDKIDCPNLSTLTLSGNTLETVEQFMFVSAKLRKLYLSYNKIDNLKGLENLSNLFHLHLRANRISNLDGFTHNLKHLSYLNLRENRLLDLNELIKLTCLESLRTLVVSGNDFNQSPEVVRYKTLKTLPWLERIDKEMVSDIRSKMIDYVGSEPDLSCDEYQYEE